MSQLEHQMRHRDRDMVPRVLVQAMFALMIGTTGLVAWAQWSDVPKVGVYDAAPAVERRDIVLTDTGGGVFAISDADGTLLARSDDERAGFLGVMGRVIARQRSVRGLDAALPVAVVRRADGNIAIVDAATGITVDLIGYGRDNVAAFANLLD